MLQDSKVLSIEQSIICFINIKLDNFYTRHKNTIHTFLHFPTLFKRQKLDNFVNQLWLAIPCFVKKKCLLDFNHLAGDNHIMTK